MFGMSGTEILLILLVVLLLFGPKKLPEMAKGLGKALRQYRAATDSVKAQMNASDDELSTAVREVQAAAQGLPSPEERRRRSASRNSPAAAPSVAAAGTPAAQPAGAAPADDPAAAAAAPPPSSPSQIPPKPVQ
jgi:TatA/E family protein of Tat protein translocase